MATVNCLRCRFRHEDNGNCTVAGGFCTAVAAAHCQLLREYLDTEMTPEEVLPKDKADEIALKLMRLADLENFCSYTRLRDLAEADKDGRVVVLPGKMGDTVYILRRTFDGADVVGETDLWWDDIPQLGKTVFLTREEAEKALEAMKDE